MVEAAYNLVFLHSGCCRDAHERPEDRPRLSIPAPTRNALPVMYLQLLPAVRKIDAELAHWNVITMKRYPGGHYDPIEVSIGSEVAFAGSL